MKHHLRHKDFLCDDLFIYWRIHPTEELNAYWSDFLNKNSQYTETLNEAIAEFDAIRNEYKNNNKTEDETFFSELKKRMKETKRRKLRHRVASSVAAVFLLAMISTLYVMHRNEDNKQLSASTSTIGMVMTEDQIQLYTTNEVLEIDNNSTLDLSEKKNGIIIGNQLTQKKIILDENQTNTIVVPYGKQSALILADGSKVHLNSGTRMEFPTFFEGNSREIKVEGEIFIEVSKDDHMPFIIHTLHSQITVHGTSFNVSSYKEEEQESVVLVNGAVEIISENNSLLLKPGEMAEIENGEISQKQVNISEYIGWKDGYMQFNQTPLNEVLKKIGRYYNLAFQYDTELNLEKITCSGKLFLSENPEDVLTAFSKMTYLQYDKKNDKVINIYR